MCPGQWTPLHEKRTRFFARGALRLLILDLISETPRHGYQIIREIEERSGGFYSPSPGTVYPNLQLLEDQGHVKAVERDGKKVYELTAAGATFLEENRETAGAHRERMAGCCPSGKSGKSLDTLNDIKRLLHSLGRSVWEAARHPARAEAIRGILERANADIERVPMDKGGRNG